MGMQKGTAEVQVGSLVGQVAALQNVNNANFAKAFVARDFNGEARGKTLCALLVAALQSPGIAQLAMTADGLAPYMDLVEQAADRAFKKVFPDEGK